MHSGGRNAKPSGRAGIGATIAEGIAGFVGSLPSRDNRLPTGELTHLDFGQGMNH